MVCVRAIINTLMTTALNSDLHSDTDTLLLHRISVLSANLLG